MPSLINDNFGIHATHSPHTEPDPRVYYPPPDLSQILANSDTLPDTHVSLSADARTLSPSHSPHTPPDPRVDHPPLDYSQVLITTSLDNCEHAPNSQDGHTLHSSQPHSPHTQPDPRVNTPPIYSLPVPSLLEVLDLSLDSSPQNPHTAPLLLISSSPNPQSGEVQLDFIPPPIASPSAPSEACLTIPDAGDDAKYEQEPNRRNSCSTLASTIPEAGNDTKYEMEDYLTHSLSSSSSSTSTLVRSISSPPESLATQDDDKAGIKKAAFDKGSILDTNLGKCEMDPSNPEQSMFVKMVRSQRTKVLWAALFVVLAIMFGVLSATVWRPSNDKSSPVSNNDSGAPSANNTINNNSTVSTNNNSTVSTNNNTVSANNTSSNSTSSNSTRSQKEEEWYVCRSSYCGEGFDACKSFCWATDTSYQSCNTNCTAYPAETSCEFNCRIASTCYNKCSSEWGDCANKCPSPFKTA